MGRPMGRPVESTGWPGESMSRPTEMAGPPGLAANVVGRAGPGLEDLKLSWAGPGRGLILSVIKQTTCVFVSSSNIGGLNDGHIQ